MRARLKSLWGTPGARTLLGVLGGAIAGALYSHTVGCVTGSCPLTSNPWTAAMFGAAIGGSLLMPERAPEREPKAPKAS